MNSISAKLKSEIKRTLYTKWIWFAGFLACLLGKITQMAGQDSITWRCIFIASAILISEVFWLFELKSPKDEAVLCTKYGNRWMHQKRAVILGGPVSVYNFVRIKQRDIRFFSDVSFAYQPLYLINHFFDCIKQFVISFISRNFRIFCFDCFCTFK